MDKVHPLMVLKGDNSGLAESGLKTLVLLLGNEAPLHFMRKRRKKGRKRAPYDI
jgi:hypothetical protein